MDRGFRWKPWLAAAIVLTLGTGSYYLLKDKAEKFVATSEEKLLQNDIKAPESNRAVLLLDNGKKIYLDSAGNGMLLREKGVNIEKLADGQIVYNQEQREGGQEVVHNTLTNPRGSRVIDLTLADGSRVWLNSESSIRFPIAFNGDERNVEITGEVYFEVAKNQKKPFKISQSYSDFEVEVLGTRFNINTHDGPAKVTLLEGSVKAGNRRVGEMKVLKPGTQAQIDLQGITVVDRIDVEEVMAWKNGKFLMKDTDLKTIMKDIERWYNVKVIYKANILGGFSGEISRDEPVRKVLSILAMTKAMEFSITGDTITVLP